MKHSHSFSIYYIHHAKPHSICFLPQYQRNEIFVLTIENTDSVLKVHALYYANELLVLKVARNSFHFPQTSFTNSFLITVWFIVSV